MLNIEFWLSPDIDMLIIEFDLDNGAMLTIIIYLAKAAS